jgi:AraC family transcriptional regulator, transcriptional activator of the genes for pyochelin and ferripyochelin receptors
VDSGIASSSHRGIAGIAQRTAAHRSAPAIALTSTDFQALVEQARQQGEVIYRQTAFEMQANLPTIHIRHATLRQPLSIEQQHDSVFPLTAKFYLSGSSRVRTKDVTEIESDYVEIPGCNYLYYLPDLVEVEEWQSDEAIQVVMVYAPAEYFHALSNETRLALPLQRFLEGDVTRRFHQPLGQITATMNQVLQQILHAPHQGMMQQLYFESKALELLALQFSQWSENQVPQARVSMGEAPPTQRSTQRLSSDELERLHAARDLLTRPV